MISTRKSDFIIGMKHYDLLATKANEWFIKSFKYKTNSDEWQICRLKHKIYERQAMKHLEIATKIIEEEINNG